MAQAANVAVGLSVFFKVEEILLKSQATCCAANHTSACDVCNSRSYICTYIRRIGSSLTRLGLII
jgi:hypothetical protein